MGKIILNNIEYGTGTPNSSNVDTTNLVKKDNIVTVIDENVTDEQIPSAKAVHTVIQNVNVSVPVNTYTKEEVDNLLNTKVDTDDLVDSYSKEEVNDLLANKADSSSIVDAYTKGEVDTLLTAKADITALEQLEDTLTDYPTLEYLEEVKTDLENEIANINIPTSLPASDVYDWAKEPTKPTYTASEVGALASNGTATNASKVANNLTLQIAGTTKNTFNGSSAQTFNIPNASTSTAGVMTTAQVTKLNGIATGATKNTVTNNLTSTSTTDALSAYQGKVLNEAIDNLKNTVVDGKTSVANAINGKLGTTLSNQTSFADMAYYIGKMENVNFSNPDIKEINDAGTEYGMHTNSTTCRCLIYTCKNELADCNMFLKPNEAVTAYVYKSNNTTKSDPSSFETIELVANRSTLVDVPKVTGGLTVVFFSKKVTVGFVVGTGVGCTIGLF